MKDVVCFSGVAEKVYYAKRFPYGVRVDVCNNGLVYPLFESGDFDWGCNNRYSFCFAKAILFDAAGPNIANTYADDFNDDFISRMPERGFVLPYKAITEWLELDKGVRV